MHAGLKLEIGDQDDPLPERRRLTPRREREFEPLAPDLAAGKRRREAQALNQKGRRRVARIFSDNAAPGVADFDAGVFARPHGEVIAPFPDGIPIVLPSGKLAWIAGGQDDENSRSAGG